ALVADARVAHPPGDDDQEPGEADLLVRDRVAGLEDDAEVGADRLEQTARARAQAVRDRHRPAGETDDQLAAQRNAGARDGRRGRDRDRREGLRVVGPETDHLLARAAGRQRPVRSWLVADPVRPERRRVERRPEHHRGPVVDAAQARDRVGYAFGCTLHLRAETLALQAPGDEVGQRVLLAGRARDRGQVEAEPGELLLADE